MAEVQVSAENPKIEPLFQDNYYFIKGMLNAMLNPVCYKDRNGICLGVNDVYARQIAGLPEEEIIGCTMLELGRKVATRFPERALVSGRPLMELVEEWNRHDVELFNSNGTSIHEYEAICADGIKRMFLANRSIFRNEKGEILGLITVLQDITELNEARKSLQESEEKYRNIVETANEGIIIIDDRFRVTFANHKMTEMFGYDVEKGIGRSLWDYMDDRARAVVEKNMEKWAYGIIETYEVKLTRKDGSSVWAMVNSKPLFDKNGRSIGILAMLKDVTERKKAEEKLRKSEEKYRNIIETTNEGIVVIDSGLNITYVNKKLLEKGGYNPEEVIGKQWWDFTDEEGKAVAQQHMNKRHQGIDETYELKLIRKDGSPFWVLVSSKSLHDKDGKFAGSLSMLTDITKWKKAEEKLRESEEKYRSFIQSFEGIVFQLVLRFQN